jgi:hypothetical protein
MTSPYLDWWFGEVDAEAEAIAKAKRQIRRRGWKALKGGSAMWTGNDDDEIIVEVEKRGMSETVTLTKSHWEEAVQVRAEELTGLEGLQAMAAALKERDPMLSQLYERARGAPADEVEVAKREPEPGDGPWGELQALAGELMMRHLDLSEPAAIAKACQLRPDLLDAYNREQLEATRDW